MWLLAAVLLPAAFRFMYDGELTLLKAAPAKAARSVKAAYV
jgi:hypothetical protein